MAAKRTTTRNSEDFKGLIILGADVTRMKEDIHEIKQTQKDMFTQVVGIRNEMIERFEKFAADSREEFATNSRVDKEVKVLQDKLASTDKQHEKDTKETKSKIDWILEQLWKFGPYIALAGYIITKGGI